MSQREFPALGFDPAPGDAGRLLAAADAVAASARTFGGSAESARWLGADGWTGPAGDAYRAGLGDLPRDLGTADRAHAATSAALRDCGSRLATLQNDGRRLEAEAADLLRRRSAAHDELNRLAAFTAPAGSAELVTARSRHATARATAHRLDAQLDEVRGRAWNVRAESKAVKDEARSRITGAADLAPYPPPRWWSRAAGAVRSWLADNSEALKRASSIFSIAAAVCGVLSFVPVVGPFFAGAGIVFGAAAFLLNLGLKLSTGEGSWGMIALDAALTFIPGAALARVARSGARTLAAGLRLLPGAARALTATTRAFDGVATALADTMPRLNAVVPTGRAVGGGEHFGNVAALEGFYGDLIKTDGSAFAVSQLRALLAIPRKLHDEARTWLADPRHPYAGIYVGEKKLSDFGLPGLDDMVPSHSLPEGKTLSELSTGVYLPRFRAVLIGSEARPGLTILHEFGHLFDDIADLSGQSDFASVSFRVWELVDPRRADPALDVFRTAPGGRGESFAELFARYFGGARDIRGSTEAMDLVKAYVKKYVLWEF